MEEVTFRKLPIGAPFMFDKEVFIKTEFMREEFVNAVNLTTGSFTSFDLDQPVIKCDRIEIIK